jgi:L-iditol 2-dehydrogenase
VFAIPKTMRAVVYRGVNDLRLETVPVPRLGANELLVKVAVCGVCPTDIKKIQHGTVPPPRIFGHETAGTIVKIGAGGASVLASRLTGGRPLGLGDRVALHHHVPCLDCHYCRHRAFAQCVTYKRTGITAGFEPAGGGYAEYVRVMPFVLPGVVKIPAKNSFDEGAMLEPVNTVLKAVKRLNLLPGDNVLVAGQGPIGLMFTKILQLRGMNVLATDLLESRLKLAKKFGARWVGRVSPLRAARWPSAKTGAHGVARPAVSAFRFPLSAFPLDAAIIAVPSDAAVTQALQLVRGAGQVLLFAHTKRNKSEIGNQKPEVRKRTGQPPASEAVSLSAAGGGEGRGEVATFSPQPSAFSLDLASICLDEKDLIGSYSSDFTLQAEVARLVFSRRLDVRPLITDRFPLEQTPAAVALASRPTGDSLKILVQIAP